MILEKAEEDRSHPKTVTIQLGETQGWLGQLKEDLWEPESHGLDKEVGAARTPSLISPGLRWDSGGRQALS